MYVTLTILAIGWYSMPTTVARMGSFKESNNQKPDNIQARTNECYRIKEIQEYLLFIEMRSAIFSYHHHSDHRHSFHRCEDKITQAQKICNLWLSAVAKILRDFFEVGVWCEL